MIMTPSAPSIALVTASLILDLTARLILDCSRFCDKREAVDTYYDDFAYVDTKRGAPEADMSIDPVTPASKDQGKKEFQPPSRAFGDENYAWLLKGYHHFLPEDRSNETEQDHILPAILTSRPPGKADQHVRTTTIASTTTINTNPAVASTKSSKESARSRPGRNEIFSTEGTYQGPDVSGGGSTLKYYYAPRSPMMELPLYDDDFFYYANKYNSRPLIRSRFKEDEHQRYFQATERRRKKRPRRKRRKNSRHDKGRKSRRWKKSRRRKQKSDSSLLEYVPGVLSLGSALGLYFSAYLVTFTNFTEWATDQDQFRVGGRTAWPDDEEGFLNALTVDYEE